MVLHITQVALKLRIDVVLDEPSGQTLQNAPQWLGGALALDDFPGQLVDAPADGGVPAEDLSLDLVDVVAQAGYDGRVVVDHPVQNRVEHCLRPQGKQIRSRLHAAPYAGEVRGLTMADSDDEVVADEHVQLAEVHLFALVVVAGGPQHQEQRLAVPLELGALVGLHRVLDCQFVQVELGRQRGQVVLVGPHQPDPRQVTGVLRAALAQ